MKKLTLDKIIEIALSGAILDGQNQIHDLHAGRATPEQIDKRMRESYLYHSRNIKIGIINNPIV